MFVARRMQKNPVTMSPSASLFEAQEKMRMRAIHQIPVVSEDGKLVGILSDRDIRATVLPVGMIPGFTAEEAEKFLKNTPVEKFMKRKVIVATLTDTLEDAIGLLYNFKINALPVVDRDDKVVGIISDQRPGSVHRGHRHGRGQLRSTWWCPTSPAPWRRCSPSSAPSREHHEL
jgi:acetoin utilization protein AcuB